MNTKAMFNPRAIASTLTLLCVVVVHAFADVITVTNTDDSGPGSLRQALVDANDGDTIEFAVTGTIGLTTGELLVDKSITISGPGPDSLAVDGNATDRVFHVASGTTASISGLTITNGRTSGDMYPDDSGGGIYNDHAVLTVNDCTLSDNWAYTRGGGLYNDRASLTMNDCVVRGNFSDNAGGGLYHDGSNGNASAEINGSIFSENSSYGGGAIFSYAESGSATLNLTTTIITGNSVILDGGGISNIYSNVTLDGCTVSNNSADGNGGGGILNDGETQGMATLEITNSTLNGNSSKFNGGAIYSNGDSLGTATVQILNSTFSNNSASNFGGCIYNRGTLGTAIVQIANSTLADNSAQASGANIYNFVQPAFSGHVAANLSNSIFQTGISGGNFFNNGGTITSLGYNLSNDDGGGFLTGPGDQINTDPMLGPLQDNGGPTFTQALLPGSPAIDTGNPSFTPPPDYDQRGVGFPRLVNGRIDIGSFEVQSTPSPTPTATASATPTATATATMTPSSTPRVTPTPKSRPTPRLRPTPPPRLTPVPPPPSPRPTAWPRPTLPPHLTPVPSPTSPRPTPAPRP